MNLDGFCLQTSRERGPGRNGRTRPLPCGKKKPMSSLDSSSLDSQRPETPNLEDGTSPQLRFLCEAL